MYGVETYATVRQLVFLQGLSRREVARRLGLSRDIVSKMCRYEAPPGYRRAKPVPRVDDVAFDPLGLQHAMDPEAVEPGFLDDDDRKALPDPRLGLPVELGKPRQHAGHVVSRQAQQEGASQDRVGPNPLFSIN
jgi:transcriptional regulator with XRE-family HTH domain